MEESSDKSYITKIIKDIMNDSYIIDDNSTNNTKKRKKTNINERDRSDSDLIMNSLTNDDKIDILFKQIHKIPFKKIMNNLALYLNNINSNQLTESFKMQTNIYNKISKLEKSNEVLNNNLILLNNNLNNNMNEIFKILNNINDNKFNTINETLDKTLKILDYHISKNEGYNLVLTKFMSHNLSGMERFQKSYDIFIEKFQNHIREMRCVPSNPIPLLEKTESSNSLNEFISQLGDDIDNANLKKKKS